MSTPVSGEQDLGQNAVDAGNFHQCLSAMPWRLVLLSTAAGRTSPVTAPSIARIQSGEAIPIASIRTAIGHTARCSRKAMSRVLRSITRVDLLP